MRLLIFLSFMLIMFFAGSTNASDYEHGNGALQLFDSEGMKNSPQWVMIWVMFMMASFICGLFFVWNHPIARWVVGGMFAGMAAGLIAGNVIGVQASLSGFIALIHIVFWSPGLYQLLSKRPFMQPTSAFSIWSAVITFVILFSFIFDIRDASIYLMHVFAG